MGKGLTSSISRRQEAASRSVTRRVIQARKAGFSYEKISELEHINTNKISAILKAAGLTTERHKLGTSLISLDEKAKAVTIADLSTDSCSKCTVKNGNVALHYSKTLDQYFCPQCLADMSMEELENLAGKNFEIVLKELF